MPERKLKQLQYENKSLKRLLRFMIDENICLKNRLSETLKDDFNMALLEEVENFLNKFIQEDESIYMLWNELVETDKLLIKENFEVEELHKRIEKQFNLLRNNVLNTEKRFNSLKAEFHGYLLRNA